MDEGNVHVDPGPSARRHAPDPLIPAIAELAKRKQWVCWRHEQRGDKTTKVPITPAGHNASSTDPKTWSTFDACRKAAAAGKADGVGYVFAEDDGYTGIDLDHVILPDGTVLDWALAVVRMTRSYCEVSVSGTGLHLIVRSDQALAKGFKRTKHGGASIEAYSAGRFFTVSGQLFSHPTVKHDTGQLADVDLATLIEHPLFAASGNGVDARKKAPNGAAPNGAAGGNGLRLTEHDIDVKVSPRRGISATDLMVILENDPDFRNVWNKNKPPADASHSGYMASVARRLIDMGKSDQFVADALVEFCRMHNRIDKAEERQVKRAIAFAHTHAKAAKPVDAVRIMREEEEEAIAEGRLEECRDDRAEALKELSAHFKVEIQDIRRMGNHPGRVMLKINDQWIDIGTPTQVYNQTTVLHALNHARLASVESVQKRRWMRINTLIMVHERLDDAADEEEIARIDEWVVGRNPKELDVDKSLKWRKHRMCHIYDGHLLVFPGAEGLDQKSLNLTRTIYTVLREAGFRAKTMACDKSEDDDNSTRTAWRRPWRKKSRV